MRFLSGITLLALIGLLLSSCNGQLNVAGPSTPTATVVVLADTFFTGCAYLDTNGNKEIDSGDPLLERATFVVTLSGGAGFGALTSENRCAFITVPGGLGEEFWPVTARMEPPEGTGYQLTTPAEVVLDYPNSHSDFLFTYAQ
jgi:hypothetical protein